MALVRINTFGGQVPRRSERHLGPNMAQLARNCKLWKKTLQPWRSPLFVWTPTKPGPIQTIYRYRDLYWFHWSVLVDVAESQIPGNVDGEPVAFSRTFFTGDGPPKVTDSSIATAGGGTDYPINAYLLGIPAPTAAPVASTPAPSDPNVVESVQYVYTFVSIWNGVEAEGPPSPASNESTVTPGDIRTISGMQTAPAGSYNITHKRIYRVATADTTAAFQFVGQVTIAETSFNDGLETKALGYVLPSTTWDPPPDDLHSIVAMPNGMMAGLSGNRLCFCEPYQPHAWPVDYRLGMTSDGVALGVFGQSVAVGTKGKPYLATGVHPASMSFEKVELKQTCVSKASMVDMGEFVVYASPYGLVALGVGVAKVVTENYFTVDEWKALNPASIRGFSYDGRYIGFYDNGAVQAGFIFDPNDPDAGFTEIDLYATAGWTDDVTGALYLVIGGQIVQWDAGAAMQTYLWRSGIVPAPHFITPGAGQVIAKGYPVTFRLFANGALRHTRVVADAEGFRLPGGYAAKDFYVEVEGTAEVEEVLVAETMMDLKRE